MIRKCIKIIIWNRRDFMSNDILFKPNALIRGVLDVESKEYKAFNLILQKMQMNLQNNIDINEKQVVAKIDIYELREIFRRNEEKNIETIKKTLDRLQNLKIEFKDDEGVETTAVLIPKIKKYSKDQSLGFFMDKEVIDLFKSQQERNKNFSPVNLGLLKKAKGFYSQRLYELLRAWSGEKSSIEFSLKYIKEKLSIEDRKSYEQFKALNSAVLKPAVKEINEKFNMRVEYKAVKKSRTVVGIEFIFNDLEPRRYDFGGSQANKISDLKVKGTEVIEVPNGYNAEDINIRLLVSYNVRISVNTLKLKQEEYGEEAFIKAIKILEDRVQDTQQEKLKAPVRYLVGILENLKNKSNKATAPQRQQPNKKSSFDNFTQREYDYDKLEKQLLGWDTDDDEDDE